MWNKSLKELSYYPQYGPGATREVHAQYKEEETSLRDISFV